MAHTHDRPTAHGAQHGDHHEESDVDVRAILTFGAGLLVSAIAIHGIVWLLFVFFSGRETARQAVEYPLEASQASRAPPEPRLQTHPREDLRELRAREDAVLTSYGWVNKAEGVVRIPIEDAMKLTVRRGLPSRPVARDEAR